MTKEEAMYLLNNLRSVAEGKEDEAIDMAIEALKEEPKSIVIRSRTLMPTKDFKEWAKRIREENPNVIVIPCDAEVVSAEAEWIPVTERLPESSGAYLVRPSDGALEDYSDLDAVMIIPYEADAEAFGWWTERFDPVSLGCIGSDFYEVEVIAWMPLPEPYREGGE